MCTYNCCAHESWAPSGIPRAMRHRLASQVMTSDFQCQALVNFGRHIVGCCTIISSSRQHDWWKLVFPCQAPGTCSSLLCCSDTEKQNIRCWEPCPAQDVAQRSKFVYAHRASPRSL